jgi:hypothetical protein
MMNNTSEASLYRLAASVRNGQGDGWGVHIPGDGRGWEGEGENAAVIDDLVPPPRATHPKRRGSWIFFHTGIFAGVSDGG